MHLVDQHVQEAWGHQEVARGTLDERDVGGVGDAHGVRGRVPLRGRERGVGERFEKEGQDVKTMTEG